MVPGSYLWQGLVEIFLHGVWGRIHDRGAGVIDAKVVCRQLGYIPFSKIINSRLLLGVSVSSRHSGNGEQTGGSYIGTKNSF